MRRFQTRPLPYDVLESWRVRDKHLWQYECTQRHRAMAKRKDLYRVTAAQLANKFSRIGIEIFDLRKFARSPRTEDVENEQSENARAVRVLVAPHIFRDALKHACTKRYAALVQLPAQNTTRECSVCHVIETFDAAKNLRHICSNGHEWDQDGNAGKNLLARLLDRERSGGVSIPVIARKRTKRSDPAHPGETSQARQKRKCAERKSRLAIAREAGIDAAK